jgi:hypothetical protein
MFKFNNPFNFSFFMQRAEAASAQPESDIEGIEEPVLIHIGDPVVIANKHQDEFYGMVVDICEEDNSALVRFWHPTWFRWLEWSFTANMIFLLEDKYADAETADATAVETTETAA